MNRRSFLAAAAGTAAVSTAGCTALFDASMPDELEGIDPDRQLPVPTLGDGTIPVDVYEDPGCDACQEFQADVFPVLESAYIEPGVIEYRHYDFVVMAAAASLEMANAARAVQAATRSDDDPNGAFFAYKSSVMADERESDDELAVAADADAVDVAPDVVTDALEDETYYPTLAADWERGAEAGVEATPTVIVDGETVDTPLDPDAVGDAIENAR
ncbi:DsbA family protein [Halobiforma nitratireducens]|uniref:Protein-disulfide isomerase n=1 Tax=Halobiforma nitratireducens JCM 10879 TaxID=1227454 RepID=M0M290_9EURY|nr:thioredoxin domain-containing protein [Halobiforma nitratireducens]EMA39826.1 protein-disulfide isomerase [Halobiforma nitratireducens JCM 10879]